MAIAAPASVTDLLRTLVPSAAVEERPAGDMPTIAIARAALLEVMRTLRDHPSLQFTLLADVTATDNLPADPRFEMVYHLACLGEAYPVGPAAAPARRLRVKTGVPADDPRIDSVVPVFPSANWLEREVFDLFGVRFDGHPDLRRLLMPDDWDGYPLRKDYAVQIRKDTQSWSPLQLSPEEFAENVRAQRERSAREAQARAARGE